MNKSKNLLLLVDSNALIHRAYHALPTSMKTSVGEITNATYGFTNALLQAISEHKPSHIACCFDVSGGTFRNRMYDKYKANRKEMDRELADQLPRIYEVTEALGIKIVTKKDYEADDLIGTLANKYKSEIPVLILTGDKDTLQLVDDKVTVETFRQGVRDATHNTTESIKNKFGILPKQFVFFKALRGDPSDNIPGVSGVGEVTGTALVKEFGDIDNLYKTLESGRAKLKESLAAKLISEKKMAELSYQLATIKTDVPLDVEFAELAWSDIDVPKVKVLFNQLEFHSLVNRLSQFNAGGAPIHLSATDLAISEITISELSDLQNTPIAIQILSDDVLRLVIAAPTNKLSTLTVNDKASLLSLITKRTAITYIYNYKSVIELLGEINSDKIYDLMLIGQLLQSNAIPEIKKSSANLQEYARQSELMLKQGSKMLAELQETGMDKLWLEVEKPLINVLYKMEKYGVKVSTQILNKLSSEFDLLLIKLQKEIFNLAGQEFNILSPAQLRDILYSKLNISSTGMRKNKTGISTDAQTLEQLRSTHPIVSMVLRYREISKLKSTYVDAFPELADSHSRIHTQYNQLGAATGRISSESPNMQNIPISSEEGNEIRSAFIAEEGYQLISADYSQIELRILAHLSGDKAMIDSFKENADIHTATASKIFGIKANEVTSEQRRSAKTINFGLLYGLSAHSLSIQLGIEHKKAQEFIDMYFASYPGINIYLGKVSQETIKNGYYTTMFGRRRKFEDINSKMWNVRASAERMARNFPMQGAQADILKMAMLKVSDYCNQFGEEMRMILTVHDEIVFEVKEQLVDQLCRKVPDLMTSVCSLAVPLKVGVKVGKNWRDMKEYNQE